LDFCLVGFGCFIEFVGLGRFVGATLLMGFWTPNPHILPITIGLIDCGLGFDNNFDCLNLIVFCDDLMENVGCFGFLTAYFFWDLFTGCLRLFVGFTFDGKKLAIIA
jgi:hypothetical protein